MNDDPFAFGVDRIPPSNLDAEMALLGSILVDKEMMAAVSEIVQPSDFYASLHESIFLALFALYERGEPLDKIALAEELKNRGMLDKIGGMAYLNSVMGAVPTAASAEYYARIVREKASLRALIHAGTQVTQLGYESEGDVPAALDRADALMREVGERAVVAEDWSPRGAAQIEAEGVPPVEFDVEHLIAREDGPVLLYGPPSVGKSWLALHLTICMATGEPFAGRYRIPKPRPYGIYINHDAGGKPFERRVVNVARCSAQNVMILSPKDGWDPRAFERLLAKYRGAFVGIDTMADIYSPDPTQEQGQAARDFFRDRRGVFARTGSGASQPQRAHRG